MENHNIILGVYGGLLILGGIMGYRKAQSKQSLIAGVVCGILVFVGLYFAPSKPIFAYCLICNVSAVLAFIFGMRLYKTKKFMPSGMLLLLSVGAFYISLLPLIQ